MNTLFIFLLFIKLITAYKTIIDVLSEDEQFSTLISHLQHTRLIPFINSLEGGTFFAPDNHAFEQYNGQMTKDILLYHLLPIEFKSHDFRNGQVIESMYYRPEYLKSGQRLKIIKKLNLLYYVNEARIIKKDVFVNKNTTIHVIGSVLEPPKSLAKLLEFYDKKLHDLIDRADIPLWTKDKPFTIFISSKYLLDKFNQIERNYLLSKPGIGDLKSILKYNIISEPIYLDNHSLGETRYQTESGQTVIINVQDDEVTVNGLRVLEKDKIAANGVIHVLEDMMYNSIDFDSRKYLIGLNATKFISLMDHYGLGNYLNNQTTNMTILAPMNDVIDEDDIPNNQKLQWLSYHIIDGAWSSKDLYDNMLLTTKYHSPQLNDQPQRLVVNIDQTIMFGSGHSSMVGKEVSIKGNEIYKLSNPLSLPTDVFTTLVIDLDVSSFISALYVSGVVNDIKTVKAITLFAPINDAFKSLGLLSRYLLHPSGHSDLQTILQYHIALTPLYHNNIVNTIQQTKTLVNDTLFINGSNHHQIWLGRNRDALESEEQSELVAADILVSNGVVHKVNKLLIPDRVNITHRHLLNGINANLMESILKQTGLIDQIDMTDWIILVPTDKAFEQIDLESMWNDTAQLERIAKLHILSRNHRLPLLGEQEYETLLSEDRVILREAGSGNKIVKVRGQPLGIHAHVLDIGYVTTGNRLGGIIEIDSVLFPVERGIFGLPLSWSITITSIFWIACIASLFAVCYRLGKKWTRKQSGYVPISDTPQIDIVQQEEAEAGHRIYQ